MAAEIIPILRSRRGRPSAAMDLRMELDSRTLEERRYAREQQPLIERLYMVAREFGPQAHSTVAHLDALANRHRRRWEPQSDDAA